MGGRGACVWMQTEEEEGSSARCWHPTARRRFTQFKNGPSRGGPGTFYKSIAHREGLLRVACVSRLASSFVIACIHFFFLLYL